MLDIQLSDEGAAALRNLEALLDDLKTAFVVLLKDHERTKRRLKDRAKIERAKWSLVEKLKISEPVAYAVLQKQACRSNKTIEEVCDGILVSAELEEFQDATN